MHASSAVVLVAALLIARPASADPRLLEDTAAWKSEHRGEVEACALSSTLVGQLTVWFTVEARPGTARTSVTGILPQLGDIGPTPCWQKLLETFHARSPTRLYAWQTCTVFRPGQNAPPTDKPHASLCNTWFESIEQTPPRLVAWLFETQLATARVALARCSERHGNHLKALRLLVEHAYLPTMRVRFLRQPVLTDALGDPEREDPRDPLLGECYAQAVQAEGARLVWPPSLPKPATPPRLELTFDTTLFGPKPPRVTTR